LNFCSKQTPSPSGEGWGEAINKNENLIKMKNRFNLIWLSILLLATSFIAPKPVKPLPPISLGSDGRLVFTSDSLNNRIPDFSYCGYMASEQPIPDILLRVVVPVAKGDATLRIQAALDYVASLPLDKNGCRGAVLLTKGVYEVSGNLSINASGIVLRGSGTGEDGTVLIASGTDRHTFISIAGQNNKEMGQEIPIKDAYVPVNAMKITVAKPHSFKAGDLVTIHRPSIQQWIKVLGTDHFGGGVTALGWKPGDRDIFWDRKIIAVDGETLTLDVPLTTSLDSSFGGATIATYQWPGRISQVGVENLRCISSYDKNNPKDEAHRWMAITMENIQDSWVRQVTFEHFAGSAVAVWETAKRITVEDCKSLTPVSEIGGQRRNTFWTTGQQTLFQRLYSEYGFHDFAVGFCAAGPNAFVQCESHLSLSFSGCIDSWASGVLFDIVNIDNNALSYMNRGQDDQGAGWSAANSVFWQCSASRVDCYCPPTANNWAFGTWAQFAGDGYWGDSNNSIQPRSLYYAQLSDRFGDFIKPRGQILPLETDASSSPSVEKAAELTAESVKPHLQLTKFIDQAAQRNPIPIITKNIKTIDEIGYKQPVLPKKAEPMQIVNGWLVRGNTILTGEEHTEPWWRGTVHPAFLKTAEPAITRFVPGRTGTGLTDDLNDLTNWMSSKHIVALDHNYGLWYERRRDDHERIRRMDGDVWPPFYEQPFARSGQGSAWDGLSQYDLTKYNTWFWSRLKQFADLADQKGLVLIHQNYFQHNIIEAGAHWADCPWRSANNVNQTGFPEPPPYAGDKRIFMSEQFYDITDPVRRPLHQAFIRKCLDNFSENNGVIQLIGAEFTGPFHFVKFWLQTIKEWETATGKKEMIGLSTTKDVQDSILADSSLAAIVNLIDIRYWAYRSDGTAYAPKGGQNLAPRQHARLIKVGKRSFEQTYRAVHEYRQKFPDKAVIYSGDNYDNFGWAVFMAGGSLACVPAISDSQFLKDASAMQVIGLPGNPKDQWALGNEGEGYIVYIDSKDAVKIDLTKTDATFSVRYIDPKNGQLLTTEETLKGGKVAEIKAPRSGAVVMWLSKK
jgi:hypothetical protein